MERYGLRDLRDDDELIVATMTPEQLDELSEIAVLYEAGLLIPADDPPPRQPSHVWRIPPPVLLVICLVSIAIIAAVWR